MACPSNSTSRQKQIFISKNKQASEACYSVKKDFGVGIGSFLDAKLLEEII